MGRIGCVTDEAHGIVEVVEIVGKAFHGRHIKLKVDPPYISHCQSGPISVLVFNDFQWWIQGGGGGWVVVVFRGSPLEPLFACQFLKYYGCAFLGQ